MFTGAPWRWDPETVRSCRVLDLGRVVVGALREGVLEMVKEEPDGAD